MYLHLFFTSFFYQFHLMLPGVVVMEDTVNSQTLSVVLEIIYSVT